MRGEIKIGDNEMYETLFYDILNDTKVNFVYESEIAKGYIDNILSSKKSIDERINEVENLLHCVEKMKTNIYIAYEMREILERINENGKN